ncbi:thioredoxin domain-containing protein [Persephonella hydrogeniphila]|nr:thioredoxin domain-containing protein [Persephonella hydrogeniphila]
MPNRLINEKSPYLKQHASNPVDWYPWSKEAFEKAIKEDKPIFLSIGYSTCHWCHVMEKESFEDKEIAEILNENFVSIKVDREERPDIDSIYMNVCMMMTGRGGWPLTIFMTPDKRPFYAGTYFPKEGSYTRIGLKELLLNISKLWKEDRKKLLDRAEVVVDHLKKLSEKSSEEKLTENITEMLYQKLKDIFDPYYGGFGRRPKFPVPHNLLFLMRYHYSTGKENSIEMVKHTLTNMRLGGIHDHIGYGFHRYSTDERWFLPHFEKMLYDQATLLMAYTEAFQITGESLYKQTVEEIIQYLTRNMLSPEGGFYSAEDADSEGEEGKFYVWSYDELKEIVEDIDLFEDIFGITQEGNYREEHTGRPTGKNILYMRKTLTDISKETGISEEKLSLKISNWRKKLFSERKKRVHPLKDTKILTDWNGLVIAGLSKASVINPEYIKIAKNTADFILSKMKTKNGTVFHRYKDGDADIDGFLSDYSYLVWGLIELYQHSFEEKYLIEAVELTDKMIKHFWDKKGGFYDTPDFGEELIVRPKEGYDGAIPSGNSVAVYNLFRLYRITGNTEYRDRALKTIEFFAEKIKSIPSGYSMMILGFDFYIRDGKDIVISGKDFLQVEKILKQTFDPYRTVVIKKDESLNNLIPHLREIPVKERSEVYICENFSCGLPLTDIEEISEKLIRKS